MKTLLVEAFTAISVVIRVQQCKLKMFNPFYWSQILARNFKISYFYGFISTKMVH